MSIVRNISVIVELKGHGCSSATKGERWRKKIRILHVLLLPNVDTEMRNPYIENERELWDLQSPSD